MWHSVIVPGLPFYEEGARFKWQWLPRRASRGGKDLAMKNGWYHNFGYRFSSNFDEWGREI